MKCLRCQHESPPAAKFCVECAAPLAAAACARCGTRLPPGAKFCPECALPAGAAAPTPETRFASPVAYTPTHIAEKILDSRGALEGERKHVTVLFADLKGSMELLADRDAEDARRLLDAVLERMIEAVHHYEGTVNQVMGDGIMALFGAPIAHEDHAVRACYAALRMQQRVKEYAEELHRSLGLPVHIRVGLNSGEVVVRSIGSDLHMDYTAIGQTTHLAARMEQMAMPGTILIPSETLALIEGYVLTRPLGPRPVKGLDAPLEVYELTGASPIRSRLHAAAARGLTRFVGRDPELQQLALARDRSRAGTGQLVAVVGEPGVGKSRLYWEFSRSPSSSRTCTGSTARRSRCSTASSRVCRRRACCCSSTIAPSTSTAGAARPTTPSSGSIPSRPRARRRCSTHCWGRAVRWSRSSACSSTGPRAIRSFSRRACGRSSRPAWSPASAARSGSRKDWTRSRCRPPSRPCSPRGSTGCRRRSSTCSSRPPSSARPWPSRCSRRWQRRQRWSC